MQINILASVFIFALIGAYQLGSCLKSDEADPGHDVPAQIVYVAFQHTLELNCSVEHLCKGLVSSDHILWKHNNTWIQNVTHRINNNTVQLRKRTISFEDAGVYECTILNCSQFVEVHARIVTVVVGVKPPRPKQPRVAVFGMPPQNVTISWTARRANWTNEVRIGVWKKRCVYAFTRCKQRPNNAHEALTCSVGHSVLEKLFPRKQSTNATQSTISHLRRDVLCLMLKVSNAFGSSFSQERWCNLNYETRCPAPRDLRVTVGDHNVTASWLRPRLVLSRYPLVYHLEYRTKSLLGRSPEKPQLLDFEEDDTVKKDVRITYRIPSDLVPYSKYEFRLSCSFLSREFGPDVRTEVTTKEAAPSEAPLADRCGMKIESLKSCLGDALIAWKLPPNNTWNGLPKKFTAHYWQDISSYHDESLVDFNGSATEGVLKDVNACKNVTIRLSMCTKGGCGPLSWPCFIRAKNDTSKDDLKDGHGSLEGKQENNVNIWVASALGISAGVVVAFILVGSIRRKRLRKRRRRRLSDLVGPLNDFPRYENEFDDRPNVCEASQEYDEVVICDSRPLLKDITGGIGKFPVTRI